MGTSGTGDPASAATWPDVVARLRAENAQLQLALRHRAVIEQAKGWLSARSGMDVESAFRQLVRISRARNIRLVDVAAGVLARGGNTATTVPSLEADDVLASRPLRSGGEPARPLPEAVIDVLRAHAGRREAPDGTDTTPAALLLARSAAQVAGRFEDLLADLVTQCVWPAPARRGLLYLLAPDGALDLAATVGAPLTAVSAWRRIPPGLPLPPVQALRRGDLVWVDAEAAGRLHQTWGWPLPAPGCAVPVAHGTELVGVLWFGWDHEPVPGPRTDEALKALAAVAAERITSGSGAADDGMRDLAGPTYVLEAFDLPAVVLHRAARATAHPGSPAEWVVTHANAAAAAELTGDPASTPVDPVGRRLLEVAPFEPIEVVAGLIGAALQGPPARQAAAAVGPTGRPAALSALRIGDGIVLTWR